MSPSPAATRTPLRETPALDRWPELRPFVTKVVERYGDRLRAVLLYGSRARGEEHEESDYDVAVVLGGRLKYFPELDWLADAAFDTMLAQGLHIQARPIRQADLAARERPFLRNVAADGIPLWP